MNERKIIPMSLEDCPKAVEIHLQAFEGFFLSLLGPSFLSLLYKSIIEDDSGIAFVAKKNEQILGFVAGTIQPTGFYSRLIKRHLFEFFLSSLFAFYKNPEIAPRLFRALKKPGQSVPKENCATLMSIAVDPICQSSGVGKELVTAFLEEARSKGSKYVNLTTDAINNENVNRFYLRMGFELFRSFTTPEGREMNEYLIAIDGKAEPVSK